jgi:hypothetical protein
MSLTLFIAVVGFGSRLLGLSAGDEPVRNAEFTLDLMSMVEMAERPISQFLEAKLAQAKLAKAKRVEAKRVAAKLAEANMVEVKIAGYDAANARKPAVVETSGLEVKSESEGSLLNARRNQPQAHSKGLGE